MHVFAQRRLEDHLLIERWPADAKEDDDPDWYALKVGHLFERKPDRFRCKTPSDAKIYEATLIEAMQIMKAWLDENADPAGTTVLEF